VLDDTMHVLLVEQRSGESYAAYHCKCGEGISKKAMTLIEPCAKITRELRTAIEYWGSTPGHEFPAPGYIIDRPATLQSMIKQFQAYGGVMINDSFLSTRQPFLRITTQISKGSFCLL
jgi:hypothetical protein